VHITDTRKALTKNADPKHFEDGVVLDTVHRVRQEEGRRFLRRFHSFIREREIGGNQCVVSFEKSRYNESPL
jgi:hypothetical protein